MRLEASRYGGIQCDALAAAAGFDACRDGARVAVLHAAAESRLPVAPVEAFGTPHLASVGGREQVDAAGVGERDDRLLQLGRDQQHVVVAETVGVIAAQVLAASQPRQLVIRDPVSAGRGLLEL